MKHEPLTIPQHIAIIMDGNRRWAREQKLPIYAGHRKVADDILEPLIEYGAKCGIKYMTFWAFSTENWNRDAQEVQAIMRIFEEVIKRSWLRLHEKGVRIRVIGDISRFSKDIQESLIAVQEQTKDNKTITAVFALNYGGRDEILRAIGKWHEISNLKTLPRRQAGQNSKIAESDFEKYLDTAGIPDPDLIVRTGGEMRMSGFLPWQSVYSEYYFPTWYMPEFTPDKLNEILMEYKKRQRRFGK